MADLKFELVTPDRLVMSDDVYMVVVPGTEGDSGILAGHAPYMTTLRDGDLSVYRTQNGQPEKIPVTGGFAEVSERGLTVLASIANVAPFVGLFGTVFGIVHTLQSMTASAANGIDAIAGPIGQALVATGIGIGVAIPAVLAYNLFLRRLKTVTAGLDEFGQDLIALAEQRRFRIGAPVHAALAAASNAGPVRRAAV